MLSEHIQAGWRLAMKINSALRTAASKENAHINLTGVELFLSVLLPLLLFGKGRGSYYKQGGRYSHPCFP